MFIRPIGTDTYKAQVALGWHGTRATWDLLCLAIGAIVARYLSHTFVLPSGVPCGHWHFLTSEHQHF